MDAHKNARPTYVRRLEMVREITEQSVGVSQAAQRAGVTAATARKWLGRYLVGGEVALVDASSRPTCSPRTIAPATALAIVELRHRFRTHAFIARVLGVSKSTVGRVLARAGLSLLSDLLPVEPVTRYEHAAPGDLLHIDTKKLGRIERPSHRVTGNRRDAVRGVGWETLFVAIDDHARIGFTAMQADERTPNAIRFLRNAVAYYASLGIVVKRLLTDNGPAFRSRDFRTVCDQLGIVHRFTRPYRPQTNGKAERFIQSALREWAYGTTYQHSTQRTAALDDWIHHYNWHRPHQGIGGVAPVARLSSKRYNLLTLHS